MKKIIMSAAVLMAIGALLYFANIRSPHVNPENSTKVDSKVGLVPASQESIVDAVNKERSKAGVAPLKIHENLTKSAQMKADDMQKRGYRSSYLPDDPTATDTEEVAALTDPICSTSSETIFYDKDNSVSTTEKVMQKWLKSESSKKAMLDSKYTLTGVGVANKNIVVQQFCVAM